MKTLKQINKKKFIKNLVKFTAPYLAIFFAQLAAGVPINIAWPTALMAVWGAVADYLSKIK